LGNNRKLAYRAKENRWEEVRRVNNVEGFQVMKTPKKRSKGCMNPNTNKRVETVLKSAGGEKQNHPVLRSPLPGKKSQDEKSALGKKYWWVTFLYKRKKESTKDWGDDEKLRGKPFRSGTKECRPRKLQQLREEAGNEYRKRSIPRKNQGESGSPATRAVD